MNLEMQAGTPALLFSKTSRGRPQYFEGPNQLPNSCAFFAGFQLPRGEIIAWSDLELPPLKLTAKASENRPGPGRKRLYSNRIHFQVAFPPSRGRVAVSDICFLWTYDWCHITQRRSNTFKRCFSLWKFVFVSSHSFCWLETAGCWWKITLSLPQMFFFHSDMSHLGRQETSQGLWFVADFFAALTSGFETVRIEANMQLWRNVGWTLQYLMFWALPMSNGGSK